MVSVNGIAVMVVDDEPEIRDLLGLMLELDGATVVTAESARAAVALMEGRDVDVVLTDLAMPGEDGYWLLEQVRARRPELPVLALTGHLRDAEHAPSLDDGFSDILSKPVDVNALRDAVARAAQHD
jgi:two-component system, chemotaxis family, CheB/CheR fusion protein